MAVKFTEYLIRFGSLINSILIVLGALALVYQRGVDEEKINSRIAENAAEIVRYAQRSDERWDNHNTYHRDRLAEVKRQEGQTAERFTAIDQGMRRMEQHDFRISSLETQMQSMNTFMNDTRRDLSSLVTSMKLVEQAIVNMDARQTGQQSNTRRQ